MDFSKDFIEPDTKLLGIWINLIDGEDTRVKIRPYDKQTYYLLLAPRMENKKLEIESLDTEVEKNAELRKFTTSAWVECFILDWENVEINGEKVEFSVEQATRLMIGSNQFAELIDKAVDSISKRIEERDEKLEKN